MCLRLVACLDVRTCVVGKIENKDRDKLPSSWIHQHSWLFNLLWMNGRQDKTPHNTAQQNATQHNRKQPKDKTRQDETRQET